MIAPIKQTLTFFRDGAWSAEVVRNPLASRLYAVHVYACGVLIGQHFHFTEIAARKDFEQRVENYVIGERAQSELLSGAEDGGHDATEEES